MIKEHQMLIEVWGNICPEIDQFLFFAENGCGDYYGYRKGYQDEIFLWEHETQESTSIGTSLLEFIEKYYEGEI